MSTVTPERLRGIAVHSLRLHLARRHEADHAAFRRINLANIRKDIAFLRQLGPGAFELPGRCGGGYLGPRGETTSERFGEVRR